MAAPGFLQAISIVTEMVPDINFSGTIGTVRGGTIGAMEGTIASSTFGTIVGGILIKTKKLSQLSDVAVIGFAEDTGSVIAMQVFGFGKALGSMIGSFLGTVIADSNHVLVMPFVVGTTAGGATLGLLPAKLSVGATVVGTIVLLTKGV